MQEESRWREALAQQIASHARANPKVAALVVEGSVARGYADGFSDLDLAVFWAEPPTAKERRDIVTCALERDWHLWPSFRTAAGWQTRTV
ncbi:MAG TPA: nucleotidyltransferase domain-containing protein [Ktedonobacteraceae bacterium]|nr:nucleotidyltransferase domain-containing protein [Ktedonobacteraceae bacterium]